ncbi:MAG: hypothetical protein EOP04_26975 [Proteobacteria bacterium]|nr:MAG: hypothetical protein EOP04_26975 [Pseudomonadota bacterium]
MGFIQLRTELKKKGLETKGTKQELVARLDNWIKETNTKNDQGVLRGCRANFLDSKTKRNEEERTRRYHEYVRSKWLENRWRKNSIDV